MAERNAQTTKIGGGADYAKVAERLKLFREDHSHSKQESAYEVDVDGSLVFTVWLWKDKTDLIDLMKSGVTDPAVLRSSSDANGNAKGEVSKKEKDFEKLETIALGRALANLGYLASGEIASSEEMEAFEEFRDHQLMQQAEELIGKIELTTGNLELNKLLQANSGLLKNKAVVEAARLQQQSFTKPAVTETKPQPQVANVLPTKMPKTLKEANDPKSPGYSAKVQPTLLDEAKKGE